MAAMRLLLAIGLVVGGASAESAAPNASVRETVTAGFVLGFVSDSAGKGEFLTCESYLLGDVDDLKEVRSDFVDALKQKNISKIADGLTKLTETWLAAPKAGPSCSASADEVKSLIASLRQFHGLRDFGQKFVSNFLDNAEEIGGDIQDSKKQFDGKQYLNAGWEMGHALRKAVLDQSNSVLAANIREAIAAGFVLGVLFDNDDVLTCGQELLGEVSDFKTAVQDFLDALKTKNIDKVARGLDELADLIHEISTAKPSCRASEADLKAFTTALRQFDGLRDLASKLVDNILDDGKEIGRDIQDSKKQFDGKQYLTSGRDMGVALRKAILGKTTSAFADILV